MSFGPAAMVALHPDTPDPRVEGLFTIGVTLPPGLEGEDIAVQWSLQRDGGVLYQGVIPDPDPAGPWVYYTASGQTQTLQLPWNVWDALFSNYIPRGQNSVTYVLTAQGSWMQTARHLGWLGERIDNTPASVQFKVVRDTRIPWAVPAARAPARQTADHPERRISSIGGRHTCRATRRARVTAAKSSSAAVLCGASCSAPPPGRALPRTLRVPGRAPPRKRARTSAQPT